MSPPSTSISCVICDDVRQEKSGKNTLVGVYNDSIIFLQSAWEKQESKAALSQLYFATFISNVPEGPTKIAWRLEDPDGTIVGTKNTQTTEIKAVGRTQAVMIRFVPMVFERLGEYRFCIDVGDTSYQKAFDVRIAETLDV